MLPPAAMAQDSAGADVSPAEAAIRLAGESTVLGSAKARSVIDGWLKSYAGKTSVLGWNAQRIDDRTFLVGYTFNGDALQKGWFFEVDVPSRKVKNVSGNRALEEKYHVRQCPPSEAEDVKLGYSRKGVTPTAAPQPPGEPLCLEP
jgi:hypothetical protein